MKPTESTFLLPEGRTPEKPLPWWHGLLVAVVLTVAAVGAGWLAGGP